MVSFTQLPPEIVHAILSHASPDDLVSLRRVNHWFQDFVWNNAALCRSLYCSHFDEPPDKGLDWVQEIHDFLRLKSICASMDDRKTSQLPFVYATAKRILSHSARVGPDSPDTLFTYQDHRNKKILTDLFRPEINKYAFFCRSFLFENARERKSRIPYPPAPVAEQQMSAELHSLFGTVVLGYREEPFNQFSSYPFAAAKVYDIREYTQKSRWGPFRADGSGHVDWEKIEAVIIVLRYNIMTRGLFKFPILAKIWDSPFAGAWPESYVTIRRDAAFPAQEPGPLDLQDPFGVTGTWMRVVCFLDYSDFFRFNFPEDAYIPPDRPRSPLDEEEEVRLIIMKLTVKRIEPPGEDEHPDYPIVHFDGVSYALDNPWDANANSDLRGSCRMTKEGQVHWTTYSVFGGQDRWRSESVQLGGPKSGRGVIGNWFDANYDPQGPCGPTAFWKVHEKSQTEGDDRQFEAFPYFLAGSTDGDFNIVININHHHFGGNFGAHLAGNAGGNHFVGSDEEDEDVPIAAGHGHHHGQVEIEVDSDDENDTHDANAFNLAQYNLMPFLGTLLEQFMDGNNQHEQNEEDGSDEHGHDEHDEQNEQNEHDEHDEQNEDGENSANNGAVGNDHDEGHAA